MTPQSTWIDVSFDVRKDAGGRDPDFASATLRCYHQLLWSKPLQDGTMFLLDTTTPGVYLHHQSARGEFALSSDSVIATFHGREAMRAVDGRITNVENDLFTRLSYTVGGMMIFPAQRVAGKQTINGARGFHPKVSDRMDLTLECIRRYYCGEASPLAPVLERYADFFSLFVDFVGYVEFFLLHDLVTPDRRAVNFFMPFDNFRPPAVPKDGDTYRVFRQSSIEFIHARNHRINALWGPRRENSAAFRPTPTGGGREQVVMGRVRHRR